MHFENAGRFPKKKNIARFNQMHREPLTIRDREMKERAPKREMMIVPGGCVPRWP
jgi:hypothetical protein